MRSIVVDDEHLARHLLRTNLQSLGVEVIAEGETGLEAIQLAEEHSPDIVFCDIRMPDLSGMEAAAAISQLPDPPLLVLVTGYAEHAAEAFEKAAFDYLLKPVSSDRLSQTIERARTRLSEKKSPLETARPSFKPVARLPIRTDYAIRLLRVETILCAVTKLKRVIVHTADESFKTNYTLNQLEQLLPSEQFLRIHASAIVQIDAVEEINFLGNHTYDARLKNDQIVPIGRGQYPELQRRLGLVSH